MDDWLWSPVPRRLRVRGTVVVGSSRLPLRVFLIGAGFGVSAALLVVIGVPIARVALLAPICGVILLLVEGSWAGRSTRELVEIGVAHVARSRRLRLQPVALVLPAEQVRAQGRAIRWAAEEQGDADR